MSLCKFCCLHRPKKGGCHFPLFCPLKKQGYCGLWIGFTLSSESGNHSYLWTLFFIEEWDRGDTWHCDQRAQWVEDNSFSHVGTIDKGCSMRQIEMYEKRDKSWHVIRAHLLAFHNRATEEVEVLTRCTSHFHWQLSAAPVPSSTDISQPYL